MAKNPSPSPSPAESPAAAEEDTGPGEDELAVVVTSDGVEHVGVLPVDAAAATVDAPAAAEEDTGPTEPAGAEAARAPALDRLRDLISRDLQTNYSSLRAERGWTWERLAADLEQQAAPLPPEHGSPYKLLARWARAEGDADPSPREGTTPQPAAPRAPERDTQQRPSPRTA